MKPYSLVSIIVPCLNEGAFIKDCIYSLLQSNFPDKKREILVVDGGSTDDTIEIVNEIIAQHPQVSLLHNPNKTVPFAMNLGAKEAKGEIIIRTDAHAIFHADYILNSVETLLETEAAGVGGSIQPDGKTTLGKSIAAILSLPIATGGAKWRGGNQAGPTDTIWCGCFWKTDFFEIGGFNEKWDRNQDAEFNHRIRKTVGELFFNPEIKAIYFVRESFSGIIQQYFEYGRWRAKTAIKHKKIGFRQITPLFFTLSLFLSLLLLFYTSTPLIVLILAYALVTILSLVKLNHRAFTYIIAPLVLFQIHLSWGLGFILGFAENIFSAP